MRPRPMDKPRHGGHLLARALKQEGVRNLFTLSGGHIAPIYDGCVDDGIRIVDFRHEQAAAHAADGWARVTGRPGVAAVTAGPGVTDAVTGVTNAFYANSPMLLIGGKSPLAELEMGSLPEGYRTEAKPLGDADMVKRAVRLLRDADHPVIFAGSGVRWSGAHEALAALADALKLPVFLNSLGRGCLPPDHPSFFSAARKYALGKADVILALGVDWDFRLGFGRKGMSESVRVIQVDVDAVHIGRNRPVDVGIVGDPGRVIAQLLDAGVGNAEEPAWTAEVRDEERRLVEEARAGMESDAVPIHPQRFAREIRDFLDHDAVVVGDGGDIVGLSASIVHARAPGHWLDPGPFGCLGVGPSFAMAAKLAKPDTQVLIVYGDGSFGLNAMEYESAIRQDIPFVGIIGNDGAWGQIRVAQEALYGSAPASVLSQEAGYHRMVEGLGGHGELVTEPGEIRPALGRAFESGVPACVNVLVDPSLMRRASYLG